MSDYSDYIQPITTRSERYRSVAGFLSTLCFIQALLWGLATFLPLKPLGWILVIFMGVTSLCSSFMLRVMSVSNLQVRSDGSSQG